MCLSRSTIYTYGIRERQTGHSPGPSPDSQLAPRECVYVYTSPGPFGWTESAASTGLEGFPEGVGCRLEARTDLTEFSGGEVDAFLLSIRAFLRAVGSRAHGLQLLGQLLNRPSQLRQLAGNDLGVFPSHPLSRAEFYDE
jgi:hypothetical protein